MSQDFGVVNSPGEGQSSRILVHMLAQFLLAVRYRKNVVIASLVACALLGGLYFATATRFYGAKAGMLMMQTGMDEAGLVAGQFGEQRNLMKTFESVVSSPRVIEGALERLRRAEDRVDLAGVPKERWVHVLRGNLSTKVVPTTNILEVSYQSKDPAVAVTVLNAVIDSYLTFLDQTHKGTAGEISRVLTKERVELAGQLQQRQQELIEAKRYFGDLGSNQGGEILNPVIKRAIYFTDELNAVQRQRIELQATLAAIQTAVRNGEDLQQHLLSVAETVGRELLMESFGLGVEHARVRGLVQEQLIRDRAELQTMQGRLGAAHPEMVARRALIRQAEEYLQTYETQSADVVGRMQRAQIGPLLIHMVQQKLSETLTQENALQAQCEASRAEAVDLTGRLATLDVLEHDVERLRNLNDVLTSRIASLDLQQDGQEVRAAVIDQPMVNTAPISPRLPRVGMIAIVLGLGIGLGIVYVLDILDDRFRSPEDMQHQLGVPVLAMIRQLPTTETVGLDSLQVHVAPTATESEAFRTLRTALALADQDLNRIVVTSAEPGDGKTTVLANLAVCYAQSGKKTLLVDGDLRRPGLTNLMQMQACEGLSTILRSDDDVAREATAHIQASGIDKLDVLPSGPRSANPAELLAGPRMADLIDWAGTLYDRILIDSPPALATSDAAVLGRLVDGVLLVIQPDKNHRRGVIRAVESLVSLRIAVPGVVLNRIGNEKGHGYYGYGYGYGYGYATQEEPAEDALAGVFEDSSEPPRPLATSPGVVPRRVA
ncbi:MAG: polysaccharide biosynthesis tyrosine autokinase [Pirellulales bacterium]|nr:polysaccharide biosynthesis tyrosine autokinase [Pirellulales bacterium]